MEQVLTQLQCTKHANKQAVFIKTKNIAEDKQLFYCLNCINNDKTILLSDFNLIEDIVSASQNSVIGKWPPLDNNSLIDQIQTIINGYDSSINQKIIDFFDDLKKEINQKLDEIKKNFIKNEEFIKEQEHDILIMYQEMSKLSKFQQILKDDSLGVDSKQNKCYQFINSFLINIKQNTNIINNSLQHYQRSKQATFDFQKLKFIRDSTLQQVDQFNQIAMIQPINNLLVSNQDQQVINSQSLQGVINLLPNLKIQKCKYSEMYSKLITVNKNDNNEINIISKKQNYANFYSDKILDRKKKYIFRVKYQSISQNGELWMIGLVRDSVKDSGFGFNEKMSCCFQFTQNEKNVVTYKGYRAGYGIDKIITGDCKNTKNINCLELRVCINDGILQILDYPNYQNQIDLIDEYLNTLQSNEDLRLNLYLGNEITVTLSEAKIVERFDS